MKNKDIEEFDRKYSTIMKIQWLVMCTKKRNDDEKNSFSVYLGLQFHEKWHDETSNDNIMKTS